jgi:hypothetical protein
MNSFRIWISVLLFSLSVSAADTGGGGSSGSGSGRFSFNFRDKAQKKEVSRWSLQEWLAQKDRNRLMDQWLMMNSPSPYEFFLKGSMNSYKTSYEPASMTETSHQSYSGSLGAYATVMGLEGSYENNTEEKYNDVTGSVNIRVLGNAVQGTHLIFRYGLRTRTGSSASASGADIRVANQFAGADLNLYLTRFFGLQGVYHHFLPADEPSLGTVTGSRSEAGAFIDFSALRVFGNIFTDTQKNETSGTTTTIQRTGTQLGLQFFF